MTSTKSNQVACIYLSGGLIQAYPADGDFDNYVWNDNIGAYIFKSFSDSTIQDEMLKTATFNDLPTLFDRLMAATLNGILK